MLRSLRVPVFLVALGTALLLGVAGSAFARVLPPAGQSAGLEPSPQAQELTIRAIPVLQFDTATLKVTGDGSVTVHFINEDTGVPHNFAAYTDSSASTPLAAGSVGAICTAPCNNDVTFALPAPAPYFFRCDVHPTTMTGTFTVNAPAQQPTATPTQPAGAPTATPGGAVTPAATQVARVPATGAGPTGGGGFTWWWPLLLVVPAAAALLFGLAGLRRAAR